MTLFIRQFLPYVSLSKLEIRTDLYLARELQFCVIFDNILL
jgi:hypothetical protein